MRFRKFFLIVTLLMAFTMLSLPVSAETVRGAAYTRGGYSGSETEVFTLSEGDFRRLDMTDEWDFLGDVLHVKRHMEDGWCTAYAILDTDECEGETVFTLEMNDDLSDYGILRFGLGVTSYSDFAPVRAELELVSASGERTVYKTELPEPEDGVRELINWNVLSFDLSDFPARDETVLLVLTLTYDTDNPPNVLRITNPYALNERNSGFDRAEKYLTDALTATVGTFGMNSGAARPDERGQLKLGGTFVLGETPKLGADAFLEITLSRVTSGGLTVGIAYENGDLFSSGRISLASSGGREVYTIPIDTDEPLRSFELNFDSIVSDAYFRLESVRLHFTERVEITGNPELGRVTSVTHSGNSVLFSGTMERDAAREYGDYDLCFYAIPGWTSDDLRTAVEIGRMNISTRFDYTADLSAYPYLVDTYRFFVGICADYGAILPLSAPAYPNAANIPETNLSNIGLYDAASVGAFESNASHVIVDVPVDRLLTDPAVKAERNALPLSFTMYDTTPDANLISSRTRQTPVNHDLLKELDSEINFYISAGLEVYLRMNSETCIPGLTYEQEGADFYSVCPANPEARYFYTAIVRFLCNRYSGIGGLIVGETVNDGRNTGGGIDTSNAAVYARELAELCRITYNAAASEIPDILVVLPFGAVDPAEENPYGAVDAKSLTVMMSSYLENMGAVPWVMMYCTDTTEEIVSADLLAGAEESYSDSGSPARRIEQFANELGLDGSADILYFYEPSYESARRGMALYGGNRFPEYLADRFAELCVSTRARAVFLSLDRLNGHLRHEFYSYLKKTESLTGAGAVSNRRSVTDGSVTLKENATDALTETTASFLLWDFSDKFYPFDWIAGGGVSSCSTVYSELFSPTADGRYARVLRSVVTPESHSGIPGTAAGISLRNLTRTVDFTGVDYLEFTFALTHPGLVMGTGNEGGSVVFVFGSDDRRIEFEVENAAYGQILTYVCDLSAYEYRGKVDFLGIMVYAENEVYLDLSSVKVYSKTLDPSRLREVFFPPEADVPSVDLSAVVLTSAIVFTVSVMAGVLLIRHDLEERRERQMRRRTEEQHRRKRERIRR